MTRNPASGQLSRREVTLLLTGAAAAAIGARPLAADAPGVAPRAATRRLRLARPRPTPSQLAWQRDEFALFLHFGVNTFTDREWGDGREDPALFNPAALDARQWARVAREAGARAVILTAKHHDGFCLWPTRTTAHSVASSPWRGGGGDVVRECVDAARAEGLRVGLYCSPWDRNAAVYGDSPRYNDMYIAQLTELLTQYGEIAEVWFDGANGEGPNGKKQAYDWPRTWATVRRLQPNAVMFSDAGPDVRWIGNEIGSAGDPNWSTVNPSIVTVPGVDGPEIIRSLQHGDRDGTVWRPGETDVSIRPGWFYHLSEDAKVKPVDALMRIWFSSVGRNSKLLLNVPPNRDGRIADADVRRLREFRDASDALLAREVPALDWTWRVTASGRLEGVASLPSPTSVSVLRLAEHIENGQQVARYRVDGDAGSGRWRTLAEGQTIGYCKLDRVDPAVRVERLRVTIDEFVESVAPVQVRAFAAAP
ncbi:MAG: alpha-L-fucosidase [Gemmatimonadetes bacterium]|nr:alpha-L-fucosidase [Gemmatimonadota bacterium]